MIRHRPTTPKRKTPASPSADLNPDPNPSSSNLEKRSKSRRDPKAKSKYPIDKFLSSKTEEIYNSYVASIWVPTRYIKFLDFSLKAFPLDDILKASSLYDIWHQDNYVPYCEDLVKQFHCNKHLGTNGDEKVLSSWVNGHEIYVKTSTLHSLFRIPGDGLDLAEIVMDDPVVLSKLCLKPPPLLDSALLKSKMTNIAKIICIIFSWNLIIRRGGRDQPSHLQTVAVYAILAGLHVNWADTLLENLGTTDSLGHTLVISRLLCHFNVDMSSIGSLTTPRQHFNSGMLSWMFPIRRSTSASTSSSQPPIDPPVFTDTHHESDPTPPPPPPRSASEERYQLLEARMTSLADEIALVQAHQRAERLTIDSYFQHLSSQLQCLLSQSGVQFPSYSCPSFFTTTSYEQQYSDLLRDLQGDMHGGHPPLTGAMGDQAAGATPT